MKKKWLGILIIVIIAWGCGPSDELKEENRRLKAQLVECRGKLNKRQSKTEQLSDQWGSGTGAAPVPAAPGTSTHMSWYENGQVKESLETDVDGNRHGKYLAYYENGVKKEEGSYVKGKKDGRWTYWDPEGKVMETADYVMGVKK